MAFHSTQWKGVRVSSQLFTRRAADVISEACFTAMTGDRCESDETVMISINFNSYASLAIFAIIRSFFLLFLNTKLYAYYTSVRKWLRLLLHTAEKKIGKKLRQKHINE